MKFSLLSLAFLVPLAAAHFRLDYPEARGENEDQMPNFPCGGFSQSSKRTQLPLSGSIPVALTMNHIQTATQVLLALGNDPGDNFNITLVPTFRVSGLGSFCLPHVALDKSRLGTSLTDGMNGTIQVQTSGDPTGGLYSCADVQFFSNATYHEPSSCKNNTNIAATSFSGAAAQRNANESTSEGQPQGGSKGGSTTSMGGAAPLQTAAWGVLGAAIAGSIVVL
ncbi:hypothetical protein NUU61_007379 [Penicillium alfredii]|uniref:Copper acquisition factor BIM1-like domain-containing protein n=1 Tax=Penicillium alfredii TaxID=1506179 RepID=A0A9W9F2S9_9EURO|nr:uncharacterized protein NUU61_007379 [Penicillium alfredii]KAJ5092509.1 hypothetical protein NUU61_007379 [Penicillium alfredii]